MILEVPTEELDRVSLYDVARKKREESSTPITRLLYAVYFSDSALQKIDIEAILKQQIKNLGDQIGQQPTGYLMIRGLFSLHLVEAEGAFISTWIKYLWEEFQKDRAVYQIINIITFTEDNPTRIFDKWYCDNLFQSGPQLQEMDKNDQQSIERAYELYVSVCQAGAKHSLKSAKEKQTAKIVLHNIINLQYFYLQIKSNDIAFNVDDINMLLHKRFMSLAEYIQLYIEEVQIDLDQEMLFPQNPSLTRCLEFWDNGKVE